jgi:hypothetical protein
MLHIFHIYVVSVLSGCCICLQWFFKSFKCFASVSNVCCKYFSCFVRMLQVCLSECFKNKLRCYTCCNVTHLATTDYCSCLGVLHARGGAEGWSAARPRPWEAEGDGDRGTGGPHAACGCGKRRGRGRPGKAAKWERKFLRATDVGVRCRNRLQGVRPDVRTLAVPYNILVEPDSLTYPAKYELLRLGHV